MKRVGGAPPLSGVFRPTPRRDRPDLPLTSERSDLPAMGSWLKGMGNAGPRALPRRRTAEGGRPTFKAMHPLNCSPYSFTAPKDGGHTRGSCRRAADG